MVTEDCTIINKKSIKGYYWVYNRPSSQHVKKFKKQYRVTEITATILAKRFQENMDLNLFLYPTLKKNLPEPFKLKNMKETVNIVVKKIVQKDNIGLLGDYDVDGATSTATFYKYLKCIETVPEVYIPDRIADGYGISKNSIDYFLEKNVNFVIALDCGTNDFETISYAKKKGIDIIVIDHHEVKNFGKPLNIINPKLEYDDSGLESLCTAGLTFLFIIALNRALREISFFEDKNEPDLKKLLDLVALGTICDLVPLENVNRLLVKKGLSILNKNSNLGLKTLINKLELKGKIKAADLAFYIGPCINAAGRIGNARLGFNLLVNENIEETEEISKKLITSNKERKTLEKMTYNDAKKLLRNVNEENFIFVYSKKWHPGIVGIIASKLVEEYKKPAFVVSIDEENATGSVRSIKNIDISKTLNKLRELGHIDSGGGHAMAGGLKLKTKNLEKLKTFLLENSLDLKRNEENKVEIDWIADIESLNIKTIEDLSELEPFGMDNNEPIIVIKNVSAIFIKKIGKEKEHILCTLEDIYGNKLKAIAFNDSDKKIGNILENKKQFHVLGKISVNEYLNRKYPQLLIKDINLI